MNNVIITSYGSAAVRSLQMKKRRHGSALQLAWCLRKKLRVMGKL